MSDIIFCVGLVETVRMIVEADPDGRENPGYSLLSLLFIGVVTLLWVSGGALLLMGRRPGRVLTLVVR
ncbi:hypothetical protein ACWCPQ_20140 [Nocardia sp. NPDC001965]